jgi:hypothetical protein
MLPREDQVSRLGPPDIALAGLQIWVHGRQFPDAQDYWDGNWLNITAHCGAPGSEVIVTGSFIHLFEISNWYKALKTMNETVSGEAQLCGYYEHNLLVRMDMNNTGHLSIKVEITPNQMTQLHSFMFYLDQTYLPPLLVQCESLLDEYPVRDELPTVGR